MITVEFITALFYEVDEQLRTIPKHLTGCEFSATQELLVLVTEEGNSSIRERCGQRNAEDSGAQPGTKCR